MYIIKHPLWALTNFGESSFIIEVMKVLCNTIQKFSQSPWKTELESNAFTPTLHWLMQSQGGGRVERANMRGITKLANRADCLVWLEVFLMAIWGLMCCWTAFWEEGDGEGDGGIYLMIPFHIYQICPQGFNSSTFWLRTSGPFKKPQSKPHLLLVSPGVGGGSWDF